MSFFSALIFIYFILLFTNFCSCISYFCFYYIFLSGKTLFLFLFVLCYVFFSLLILFLYYNIFLTVLFCVCRGNRRMSRNQAIDSIVHLKDSIHISSASRQLSRYILTQGVAANSIKATTKRCRRQLLTAQTLTYHSSSDGIILLILSLSSSYRITPGFVA